MDALLDADLREIRVTAETAFVAAGSDEPAATSLVLEVFAADDPGALTQRGRGQIVWAAEFAQN